MRIDMDRPARDRIFDEVWPAPEWEDVVGAHGAEKAGLMRAERDEMRIWMRNAQPESLVSLADDWPSGKLRERLRMRVWRRGKDTEKGFEKLFRYGLANHRDASTARWQEGAATTVLQGGGMSEDGMYAASRPDTWMRARIYADAAETLDLSEVTFRRDVADGGYVVELAPPRNRQCSVPLLVAETPGNVVKGWLESGSRRLAMARDILADRSGERPEVTVRSNRNGDEHTLGFALNNSFIPLSEPSASLAFARGQRQTDGLQLLHAGMALRADMDASREPVYVRPPFARNRRAGPSWREGSVSALACNERLQANIFRLDNEAAERAERAHITDAVHDGLADLGVALDMDAKAVSLDGRLHVEPWYPEPHGRRSPHVNAWVPSGPAAMRQGAAVYKSDARHGPRIWAAAPGVRAGSLARAWIHALDEDCVVHDPNGKKSREWVMASRDLDRTIRTLPEYGERSMAYAKLSGVPEAASKQAMRIRAFEAHVANRLKANGIRNPDLTALSRRPTRGSNKEIGAALYPYPSEVEMRVLAPKFERLVNAAAGRKVLGVTAPAVAGSVIGGLARDGHGPALPGAPWKDAVHSRRKAESPSGGPPEPESDYDDPGMGP